MLTLTRSGRINVIHPDTGEVHSSHYDDRKAVGSALRLAMELGRDVTIRYDQTVLVATEAGAPAPESEPDPTDLMGVAPRGGTMRTHPPIVPGAPRWYAHPFETGGDGTEASPMSMAEADRKAQPGDVVRIAPGEYRLTSRVVRSASWEGQVLFDARGVTFDGREGPDDLWPLHLQGHNEIWHGLHVIGGERGIMINAGGRNTISGALVEETRRDGIYIFGDTVANHLRDIHVRNVGTVGETGTNTADGIAMTADRGSLTYGHSIVRALIQYAPDDGLDLFRCRDATLQAIAVERAGYHWKEGDVGGDGAAIKLGGAPGSGDNTLHGALAVDSKGEAIKANSAPRPIHIEYATVVRYGQIAFNPFIVDGSTIRACVAAGEADYPYSGTAEQEANSWQAMQDAGPELHRDYSLREGGMLATFLGGGPIGATDETLRLMKGDR